MASDGAIVFVAHSFDFIITRRPIGRFTIARSLYFAIRTLTLAWRIYVRGLAPDAVGSMQRLNRSFPR